MQNIVFSSLSALKINTNSKNTPSIQPRHVSNNNAGFQTLASSSTPGIARSATPQPSRQAAPSSTNNTGLVSTSPQSTQRNAASTTGTGARPSQPQPSAPNPLAGLTPEDTSWPEQPRVMANGVGDAMHRAIALLNPGNGGGPISGGPGRGASLPASVQEAVNNAYNAYHKLQSILQNAPNAPAGDPVVQAQDCLNSLHMYATQLRNFCEHNSNPGNDQAAHFLSSVETYTNTINSLVDQGYVPGGIAS